MYPEDQQENRDFAAALAALRAEGERKPGLTRANPDEIWVRARVDEILEGDRKTPLLRLAGAAQVLTFDAAVALLAWFVLGAVPVVPLFGLALSKALVVALVTASAHVTASWSSEIGRIRL